MNPTDSASRNASAIEMDERLFPLICDHPAAAEGIALLVDCRFEDALAIFSPNRESYPSMALGYCLTLVLRAITSFEEEHKREAMEALKCVQHDCHHDRGQYRKLLHECSDLAQSTTADTTKRSGHSSLHHTIARYHVDLVLADCYLCSSMVIMMNMDWSSYAKGGWLVRKAWKLYEKLYREARKLNDQIPQDLKRMASRSSSLNGIDPNATSSSSSSNGISWKYTEIKAITGLYTAVCFGYGLFNLLLSILSPQVLKVIAFFGFSSSRRMGLDCLTVASRCDGMRSALATLSLLWFHTVARPFFALDATAIDVGIEEAEKLLSNHFCRRLTNTMLFVFFQGRIKRLQSDISGAIDHYFKSLFAAGSQKELRQMCQYELAWCYLHLKDLRLALPYFNELKETSKWAPSYYAYMVALCYGSSGEMTSAMSYFKEAVKTVKPKKSPLEAFVMRRSKKILKQASSMTKDQCLLYTLEVMYIWRALINVPLPVAEEMLRECRNLVNARWMLPLKCLLEGIFCGRLSKPEEETEQCFRECIARYDSREHKDERHWLAFATYELGYLLMKKSQTRNEAKNLLTEAKDKFHGCDFDNRLSMRVYAALRWIEREEVEEQEEKVETARL